MRKILILLPLALVTAFQVHNTLKPSGKRLEFDSIMVEESLTLKSGSDSGTAYFSGTLDFPKTGEKKQLTWLRQWAALALADKNDSLAATPEHTAQLFSAAKLSIKLDEPKMFFDTAKDRFFQDFRDDSTEDGIMHGFYGTSANLRVIWQTNNLLTYALSGYQNYGGAHGYDFYYFTVFDLIHNRQLLFDDLFAPNKHAELRKLILRELMKEYEATTWKELNNICLQLSNGGKNTETTFQFPNHTPAFTKDGVTFLYQRYEITSAYVCGIPEATFSYREIWDCLTPAMQQLLGNEMK